MAALNQLLISRILGSRIEPFRRESFGGMSAFRQASSAYQEMTRPEPVAKTTRDEDLRIAQAFEKVREIAPGRRLSPDRVLIDPALNYRFIAECLALGVRHPPSVINRRLLRFRKGTPHVKLAQTTEESEVTGLRRFTYAADFAMAQLSYRRGASVDDMLADPLIGAEFDKIATRLLPGFGPIEYRTAALYLRKTRNLDPRRRIVLSNLESQQIEAAMTNLGPVANLVETDLPSGPGILTFTEHATQDRSLYISENPELRSAVKPFLNLGVFRAVENQFWHPDATEIELKVFTGKKFLNATIKDWEAKLILERRPIFNLPVQQAA